MSDKTVEKVNQAIILAGGRGERLRPITDSIPKVMVEINGQPLLFYQIKYLKKFGINKIILSVGYLWEKIRDYFGDGGEFGINIHYSVENGFLGTGGALKLARKNLADHFFLVNGDTYHPIDLSDLESFYLSKLANDNDILGVLSIFTNQAKIINNNITVDPQNYILKYDKVTETQDMNGVDAGIAIFNKKVIDHIPDPVEGTQKVSFENTVWPKLIATHQLMGYMTDTRFYDIGTPERLKIISEVIE